jgi:hypothetical protein
MLTPGALDLTVVYFHQDEEDYDRSYARTCLAWSRAYQTPYGTRIPSYFAWQRGKLLTNLVLPPIGIIHHHLNLAILCVIDEI